MSAERGSPRLRTLHASPDAGPVDVYIDGTLSIPSVAFGQVTDYLALSPGDHVMRIYPAGAGGQGTSGGQRPEVLNVELRDLKAGQDYTGIVLGELARIGAILLHDSTEAPAAGHAKVRAVHAAPDAPAVDILADETPIFRSVAFQQASPFREVQAGMVDLEVRPSGQAISVMTLPDYTLAAGSLYTFVALGLLQGQPAFMVMPLVEAFEMQLPA